MRTTLTLDDDVARLLDEEMHRQRRPMKHVVNEALRRALSPRPPSPEFEPYRVEPHSARLLAGIDSGRLNALTEELEDEAVIERARTGGS